MKVQKTLCPNKSHASKRILSKRNRADKVKVKVKYVQTVG